jgi:exopolysaccharide biosynthesis WecB/TagA/CpsF family protein
MWLKGGSSGTVTHPATTGRIRFGRLDFITGTRRAAIDRIGEWADAPNRAGLMIGFINPHVYNCAVEEPEVAAFLGECQYVCVDGVGVTVAARLLHRVALPRVVATDLFDDFVVLDRPLNALLVGATAAEALAAADKINARSARLRIVEAVDGFRDLADYESLLERHSRIDALLVGAGSPKSEKILRRARQLCPTALLFHIGAGTIKLYADTKRKAPGILSRLGLEWVHRIVFEPHTRSRYFGGAWRFASDLIRSRSAP